MALHLREQGIPFRAVFFDTGWEHADTYRYAATLPETLGVDVQHRRRMPALDERREAMARDVEALLALPAGPVWSSTAGGPYELVTDDGHRRSALVRWMLARGMFPSRTRRFCTQELKFFTARDVMREVHAGGAAPVNVLGIRADESAARSQLPERELDMDLDAMVWRPLLRWTVEDVIAIHRRHGVTPNPLYLRNATRVGCWPCIMAGKAELRLLDEQRIRALERLEHFVGLLAVERHAKRMEVAGDDTPHTPFRPPSFFQGNRRDAIDVGPCPTCSGSGRDPEWTPPPADTVYPGDEYGDTYEREAAESPNCRDCQGTGRKTQIPAIPIRKVVEWARTDRGGAQMLMPLPDDSGCMRWGLCDLPAGDAP